MNKKLNILQKNVVFFTMLLLIVVLGCAVQKNVPDIVAYPGLVSDQERKAIGAEFVRVLKDLQPYVSVQTLASSDSLRLTPYGGHPKSPWMHANIFVDEGDCERRTEQWKFTFDRLTGYIQEIDLQADCGTPTWDKTKEYDPMDWDKDDSEANCPGDIGLEAAREIANEIRSMLRPRPSGLQAEHTSIIFRKYYPGENDLICDYEFGFRRFSENGIPYAEYESIIGICKNGQFARFKWISEKPDCNEQSKITKDEALRIADRARREIPNVEIYKTYTYEEELCYQPEYVKTVIMDPEVDSACSILQRTPLRKPLARLIYLVGFRPYEKDGKTIHQDDYHIKTKKGDVYYEFWPLIIEDNLRFISVDAITGKVWCLSPFLHRACDPIDAESKDQPQGD